MPVNKKYLYNGGHITIVNPSAAKLESVIKTSRFETRKELRKIIFSLTDSGCIITVSFDEPLGRPEATD